MRVSDIAFAAHLVPYKMRKTQRPITTITSYFDREKLLPKWIME